VFLLLPKRLSIQCFFLFGQQIKPVTGRLLRATLTGEPLVMIDFSLSTRDEICLNRSGKVLNPVIK
jgi:hypothetical protein